MDNSGPWPSTVMLHSALQRTQFVRRLSGLFKRQLFENEVIDAHVNIAEEEFGSYGLLYWAELAEI